MKLDFIDISKTDEYERGSTVPSSISGMTSKSDGKINRSVFWDINEKQNENRRIREIRNIDVSRDAGGRGKTADRENKRSSGREEGREPDRRRKTSSSEERKRTVNDNGRKSTSSGRGSSGNTVRRGKREDLRARQEREKRRKRRRRKQITAKIIVLLFMVSVVALLLFTLSKLINDHNDSVDAVSRIENVDKENTQRKEVIERNQTQKPAIDEDFLTINEYSRPGEKLEKVKNIFVHYTANRGTSAAQNRSYFENLGVTGETSASAHFIIGFDGEIVQCIPLEEIAYAVQKRNYDSISIECCFLQDDGKFTDATYQSLIRLCAWLLNEYNLAPEDMRRHYDEGGKKCPLYYVEHEEAWHQFLRDLNDYIIEGKQGEI